jgi:triacylglycerol lipase
MSAPRDHVVLIHGLGRSPLAMMGLQLWLSRAGFRVTNLGYPSKRVSIAEAVDGWLVPALSVLTIQPGERVHFVTHSLGGIVFRAWAARRPADFPLGRTVLLAPPNQGSEIMDHLGGQRWFRFLLGPVVDELGTGSASTPKRLGPVPPETAVLMGNINLLTMFEHLLEPESDGIVSVSGGHVEGEAAFEVVPADHALIMWRPTVLRLVERYLKTGRLSSSSE